jgi:hypothetical protein
MSEHYTVLCIRAGKSLKGSPLRKRQSDALAMQVSIIHMRRRVER